MLAGGAVVVHPLERKRIEVLVETEGYRVIHIGRLGKRLLRCGLCRQRCRKVHSVRGCGNRAVQYGLKNRSRPPVHVIRKGQVYFTVVYDPERRVLLWVGDDRTQEAVRPFFTEDLGRRRCHYAPGDLYGHVGALRQAGKRPRTPGPDSVP